MIDRYRKAAVFLAIMLLLLSVFGCTGNHEETQADTSAETSEETLPSETETETPPSEESSSTESSSETAESTEEVIREATQEERIAAYKICRRFLLEHREEIAGASLVAGTSMQENVALCDITGDSLPELFVVRADGGRTFFEVRDLGSENAEKLISMEVSNTIVETSRCFFTLAGGRLLYEYLRTGKKRAWYYYDCTGGTPVRTLLAERREIAGGGTQFRYMGEPCSEEDYGSLESDILSLIDNVLLYSPADLFEQELSGARADREAFGMDVERAIRFMNDSIPRDTGDADDYASVLKDFILNERYLVGGAAYVTGEDADEITFGVYDMNGDGTPELFIANGDPQFSYKTNHVYRFTDGKFIYCGDAGFRESVLWTAPGSEYPGVFCSGGHSGFISHVYYSMKANGTVVPETVTTHEDTTYKIENHDDKIVTDDYALYEVCMTNCPMPGREACLLKMVNLDWVRENGVESLIEGQFE